MKQSKFREDHITYAQRQLKIGTPPANVCRQVGVSEADKLRLGKKVRPPRRECLRKLYQLDEENARLKRVVADLTLDKHIQMEAIRKYRER